MRQGAIEFCKSTFPQDLTLRGLKIVVDAAHGAAYQVAPKVFHELGAEVLSIGCAPDGLNINHEVGAHRPEALVRSVRARASGVCGAHLTWCNETAAPSSWIPWEPLGRLRHAASTTILKPYLGQVLRKTVFTM